MAKIKVITIGSELESAGKLGYPTNTSLGSYAYSQDDSIVIRWGNSRLVYNRLGSDLEEFKNVINPSKNIKTNCSKHIALKLLAQVVNVPTIYEKSVPAGVTCVVRPFEHAAGHGFSVRKGPFKIEDGTYGTKFIETDAEYRVWFCGDKTMCGRRVKMECNPSEEYPCRSNWGYRFSDTISKELHHQTLMAAKKIGLDCGAADILLYKNKFYFLELNSAPSVDHRVVREFFQNALEVLIPKKFPAFFDNSKKKRRKSGNSTSRKNRS